MMARFPETFWSIPVTELLQQLETTSQGLASDQVRQRLSRYGANLLQSKRRTDTPTLLLAQFKSPIVLILLFAAALSFFLQDNADGLIILAIVLASAILGFWQERGAADAIEKLLTIVQTKATALRDGTPREIAVEDVVPGAVVLLRAGDVIPGDALLLESKDLFVDEAALTGETYPVDKTVGTLSSETPLSQRTNSLFLGTHVVSGTPQAVVVCTGPDTEFGKVSERLQLRPPETEFERGVRRFGYFLMEVTLLLVLAIFAVNVYLHRPVLDSFLFSLALAVGLTPQLLPAIISINLAHGAKRMARQKVIVKRLAAIENFGSMNVLCADKTGTLTEGVVRLHAALDVAGQANDRVLRYAYLNAFYETGFLNPIDAAIRSHRALDVSAYQKLDEVPYDFIRKRLSILVAGDGSHLMATKGALRNVLAACSSAETADGAPVDCSMLTSEIQHHFEELSDKGFRMLGVAYRDVGDVAHITRDDEVGMTFLGFLAFFDPPKPGIMETVKQLRGFGVTLKIITGDNQLVAANVARQVGIGNPHILTGPNLRQMSDEALRRRVNEVDVFAEVEPNQKERLILSLK